MQMIDVLKRLAELDADNPRVEKVAMTNEQSLATVSNIEGETITESINECGPMGMMGGMNTPASFSINASAGSGDEVASMLTQIMNLAGVKSSPAMGDLDHDGDHDTHDHEIELGTPHSAEPMNGNDEMADMIGMIDRMNGPDEDEGMGMGDVGPEALGPEESDSPVADMADEVRGMADELASVKDEGIGAGFDTATTTPDEKIEPHKYGNDQVTIGKKAEPEKKAGAGNPYVETVAAQLLKDYQAFVNEDKATGLSKDTLKSYNDKATKDIAKRITGDDKDLKKIGDRQKGYERASKRGVK
jgi:hypothetical protein